MKTNENIDELLDKRYYNKVETEPEQMLKRVAKNIADNEDEEEEFYEVMNDQVFLPNSPTLMNAGNTLQQLAACFALPVEDDMKAIMMSALNTALIHKSGGGTGFDFSKLRPKGDPISDTGGTASGPVSFMRVYDAVTDTVKQGGKRRGANMGMLRVDHPDIFDFVRAKGEEGILENFNLSVAITDKFMECVRDEEEFPLINPRTGLITGTIDANELWDELTYYAWKNGEPGVVFIDRVNDHNPTPEQGRIEATNPCGEQPLLPNESCNLGSINLSKMVGDNGRVLWGKLSKVVKVAVRFLDNVIDKNEYPIPEIETQTKYNRKIGLGVMGLHEMLIKMEIPYDSHEGVETAEKVMEFIQVEGHNVSAELANEKDTYPGWKEYHPYRRNATVTTVAPTGSISILGMTTGGIEPMYAPVMVRRHVDTEMYDVNELFKNIAKREGFYSEEILQAVYDNGSLQGVEGIPEKWQRLMKCPQDIDYKWHVKMQATIQKHVDNAVSKTINMSEGASQEDVKLAIEFSYGLGCKGLTVYRDGSREEQVYETGKNEQEGICPECGRELQAGEGCSICPGCGWSPCK
jgi:ribonucleoside-diphosphate reductase alpha chain